MAPTGCLVQTSYHGDECDSKMMEAILDVLGNCMSEGIVFPSPETQPHQGQKDLPPARHQYLPP